MWAGLRFVNGYSPIRPAGVAREFASAIHGDVDPDLRNGLQHQVKTDCSSASASMESSLREKSISPRNRQPNGNWQLRPMKAAFFIAVASRSR